MCLFSHFGQFFVKTQYNEPPMTIPRFPVKGESFVLIHCIFNSFRPKNVLEFCQLQWFVFVSFLFSALDEPHVIQLNPVLSSIKRLESISQCVSLSSSASNTSEGFHYWTILDYYSAYISQKTTPSEVQIHYPLSFFNIHIHFCFRNFPNPSMSLIWKINFLAHL